MIPTGPFFRLMAYGLWLMAYGLWLMAYGLWLMAYGLWMGGARGSVTGRAGARPSRYGFAGAGAGAGVAAGAGGCIVDKTMRKPIVLLRVTGSAEPR